jgi:hypothetical protein
MNFWIIIIFLILGFFIFRFLFNFSYKYNQSTPDKEGLKVPDPERSNEMIEVTPEYLADSLVKTKMMCPKCKIKYPLKDINLKKDATIYAPSKIIHTRESDGLEIRVLICFKCKKVSSYASDPYNHSGKAIDFVEYFTTYNLTKELKSSILEEEKKLTKFLKKKEQIQHKLKLEKIRKIKV